MTSARNLLPLSVVIALLGNLGTPTSGFRVAPSIATKKHVTPIRNNLATRHAQHHLYRPTAATTALLSSPDDFPNNNKQEQEMMDQALREQQSRQAQQTSEQKKVPADPLIASLTRIDDPDNVPTVKVPLFGEVPADGNLKLLLPVAAIGVLGFIFSIVVTFQSRDAIVRELSHVELPKMEYTPTVVEEGKCRGLCSNQDKDVDGLRNFMESISGREVRDE